MRTRGIFYGWWLTAVAGLVMALTSVPVFHANAVWVVAIQSTFPEWSRFQLSLALTMTRVEGGLFGVLEGYLADRFGARRMVMIGLLALSAAFVFFALTQNFWWFLAAFILLSMGQGLGGWVPLMTLMNHWFVRRRGMAMGVVMVGMGIGAMIIVPAIAWAIDPEVMRLGWLPSFPWDLDLPEGRLGWRGTGLLVACIVFVCALILPRFIYSRPEDRGLYPDGDEGATPAAGGPAATTAHTEEGLTVGQALRTQAFWCISFGHGLGSMIILAIMSQLGLLMYDLGYGVPATAGVVTVYTAVSIVFQLAGGYIGDRVPKNIALFAFTGLQAAAVVILVLAPSLGMIFLFAVLFGAGFGGRTPLTTAIRGDYFGRASFGKILGISTLPMNAMLLIAGPMAGFMRDKLGDYDLAFLSLAGLNGIGALLFLIARRPRLPAAQPTPAPMVPAAAGDA
jgi:MFS family permease